jgi:hypothetical protein
MWSESLASIRRLEQPYPAGNIRTYKESGLPLAASQILSVDLEYWPRSMKRVGWA